MKKTHVSGLLALMLALAIALTPIGAQAATPLTVANFNAMRYAQENPDLLAAFGTDTVALWNHYVNFGSAEKRKAYATNGDVGYLKDASLAQAVTVDTFNYKGYADKYPDLKAVFGYNQQLLYNHYVSLGIAEGRTVPNGTTGTPAPATAPAAPTTAVPALNNFNYTGYADKYPDLKAAYGYNAVALYNHFISYGQKEGRTAPPVGSGTAVASTPATTGAVFASVIPNSIAVLGDSISTFNGYNHSGYALYYPTNNVQDASQMWWFMAAAARGLTVVNNCSWSGSAVSGDMNKQNASAGCSWRRITDLAVGGQAPAIILIMLGTNDFNFGHRLGDHRVGEEGASSWTFTGAYDIMLTRMKATFPNSRIVCMTIPPVYGPEGPEVNGGGLRVPAYNAKICEIAAAHGIQVIDTYSVFHGGDSIEGMHPNAKGMAEIAAAVAAGL